MDNGNYLMDIKSLLTHLNSIEYNYRIFEKFPEISNITHVFTNYDFE